MILCTWATLLWILGLIAWWVKAGPTENEEYSDYRAHSTAALIIVSSVPLALQVCILVGYYLFP